VIVRDPLLVASVAPNADLAMSDTPWIRVHTITARCLEASLGNPVVGSEVRQAQRDFRAISNDDVDQLGRNTLEALQLKCVLTKLEDSRGFDTACELGVDRLVGVCAN
jgi:hypothetical protein